MAVADEQSPIPFDVWWEQSASPGCVDIHAANFTEDQKRYVRALARIAWQRGAYHAMTGNLTPPTH